MKTKIVVFCLIAASFSSSYGMDTASSEINPQIEKVIKKYNLSPNRCRTAINKEIITPGYSPNIEIACLIAGMKDVYLMYSADELNTMDSELKSLMPELNVNYLILNYPSFYGGKNQQAVMYTPKGERYALLLAKYFLTESLNAFNGGSKDNNTYLIGTFLGYKEEDKEFFEIKEEFYQRYSKFLGIDEIKLYNELSTSDFPVWNPEDKTAYTIFETRAWPNSYGKILYQKKKKQTQKWINLNSDFTNEQLHQQIVELLKELNKFPEKPIAQIEEEVYPEGS